MRNLDDLECLACPPKYRSLRQFYKYYRGEAVAPLLRPFVPSPEAAVAAAKLIAAAAKTATHVPGDGVADVRRLVLVPVRPADR